MNNIDERDKLIFFTEKGYEIPVEKVYSIQWEIIPHAQLEQYFIETPSGHFMYDIADSNHTLTTVIDKHGLFLFNSKYQYCKS